MYTTIFWIAYLIMSLVAYSSGRMPTWRLVFFPLICLVIHKLIDCYLGYLIDKSRQDGE